MLSRPAALVTLTAAALVLWGCASSHSGKVAGDASPGKVGI
jgi:hypothetical protein